VVLLLSRKMEKAGFDMAKISPVTSFGIPESIEIPFLWVRFETTQPLKTDADFRFI
jgi:hypothetical protein